MNFKEILELAIREEQAARDLYLELAEKVKDEAAKDTLLFLAREETGHRDILIAYREGRLEAQGLGLHDSIDAKVVENFGVSQWDPGWGLKEVFLAAAKKEQISHEFYEELALRHPPGAVRELLKRLAKEELAHKEKMEYLYANTAFPQTEGG